MIDEKRIVDEFIKYVKIDSETREEKEFYDFIQGELKSLGFEVRWDSAGEKIGSKANNIIAYLKGEKDKPPIMFCCHMDTVVPGRGIKPVIKDGTIYSDGTTILGSDDKAGIAAILEAVRSIKEEGMAHGDIEVVLTISEEGGLNGSKNLDYSMVKSKLAFVLDSGGAPGEIITRGPAQDKIVVKVIGKAAHAGVSPEEGISAIQVAASAISRMNLLRIDEETTANIGIIKGGSATNIVTPEVVIEGEARSLKNEKLDKQTAHMVECFEKAAEEFNAKVEIKVERAYDAFEVGDDEEIVLLVKRACESIGLKPYTTSSGGGSDTNILNSKGIKAVNLGVGMKKAHSLEEHIKIKDLVDSARLVEAIIKSL